jgi:hypothetical protein
MFFYFRIFKTIANVERKYGGSGKEWIVTSSN